MKIILIIFLSFSLLFIYSLCKISSLASTKEESIIMSKDSKNE